MSEELTDDQRKENKRKMTCESALLSLARQAEWYEINPTMDDVQRRIEQVHGFPVHCWEEYSDRMKNMRDLVILRLESQLAVMELMQPLWVRFKKWVRSWI